MRNLATHVRKGSRTSIPRCLWHVRFAFKSSHRVTPGLAAPYMWKKPTSLRQKAVRDIGVNPGCADGACTIVVFLGYSRVGVVQYGARKMRRTAPVGRSGGSCGSPEQVG